MILLDFILYANIYNLNTTQDYFRVATFILFPSIANNILYSYIIKKYKNMKAIIIYRIITTLYMYIIPIVPNIHIFFESILKVVVPYIIYVILESMYARGGPVISRTQKRIEKIISIILSIIVIVVVLLISCKFKYVALVIGSGSMTGTINTGETPGYFTDIADKI